jgi:secreted trypsin-like serine protease
VQKVFLLLIVLSGCLTLKTSSVEPATSNSPEFKPERVVKLLILDDEDNEKICSGVMVAPDRALTAWHCFDEFSFSVFGEVGRNRDSLKQLISHPDVKELSASEVINDLAIVEFTQRLSDGHVSSVASAGPESGEELILFTFGGEGATRGLFNSKTFTVTTVSEDLFRAKGERPLCHGDSGGGVFRKTGTGFELIGIASSSTREECVPGDEAIFVNLTSPSAREFIQKWMKPFPTAP